MSALMKMPLTNSKVAKIIWHGSEYAIPVEIIKPYKVLRKNKMLSIREVFGDIIDERGDAGAVLKGLRHRENLTQAEFAKSLGIIQANLSAMETGKRAIGKELAKRIGGKFKLDYRIFL